MPVADEAILQVEGLTTRFHLKRGTLTAVDHVSFRVNQGETFSLVGEFGCGKTVTARSILRLIPIPPGDIATGKIIFEREDLLRKSPREMRAVRGKRIAMVFQEPMSALNPVFAVSTQIADGLRHNLGLSARQAQQRVIELLRLVGIPSPQRRMNDYVHQFSGGMRQRIAIARSLAVTPELVVADEPVSALDVSIQAQILNLFRRLQEELQLTYLFIAHDLSVIRHISDRVAVMYVGKLVETGTVEQIFQAPMHPYTQALLAAVPSPNPVAPPPRLTLSGEVVSPINPPAGCRLYGRCPLAGPECAEIDPELRDRGGEHFVACHKV